jgi:hypothetical protein
LKIWIWSLYLLGQLVHMLAKAHLSAQSKLTPWTSIRGYVFAHWPELIFRFFANTMLLFLWWDDQQFFNSLLHHVWPAIDITVPLTRATAGIYGLFSDVILGWITAKIPFLAARLPGVEV